MLSEVLGDAINNYADDVMGEHPATSRELLRAREARAIIEARYAQPLSVSDLAQELGISLRLLQQAFAVVYDMTPRAMINKTRLEQARIRLMHAAETDTIAFIAQDCGFTHMGRFGMAYREAFGESPGATLKRSKSSR